VSDLEQLRRNVRVMDLLTDSAVAWSRGDRDEADRLINEALECDAAVVSVVRGGMVIGELPRPAEDPVAWQEYVESNREKLARAEAEEAESDG
jgi:nucleotide-binding universal stress UspA family protein